MRFLLCPAALALLALGLPAALSLGCQRYDPVQHAPLSAAERSAVRRLGRDRWVDVTTVRRGDGGVLIASTRQGNQHIDYRITILDDGSAKIERLPIVTFGSP
ncbi:MAG: hypothetical protein EA402_06270 [Planctomycetota bacterium]|nr:MAG: hypothetical protein EA402_06270 [Planctomycetota bacterium]